MRCLWEEILKNNLCSLVVVWMLNIQTQEVALCWMKPLVHLVVCFNWQSSIWMESFPSCIWRCWALLHAKHALSHCVTSPCFRSYFIFPPVSCPAAFRALLQIRAMRKKLGPLSPTSFNPIIASQTSDSEEHSVSIGVLTVPVLTLPHFCWFGLLGCEMPPRFIATVLCRRRLSFDSLIVKTVVWLYKGFYRPVVPWPLRDPGKSTATWRPGNPKMSQNNRKFLGQVGANSHFIQTCKQE